MLGGKRDRAFFGLAGGRAILGRLDAVIDRIANDVRERIAQPLDDRAVDLGIFPGNFEADSFFQSSPPVREPVAACAETPRSTCCARIDITLSFSSRV